MGGEGNDRELKRKEVNSHPSEGGNFLIQYEKKSPVTFVEGEEKRNFTEIAGREKKNDGMEGRNVEFKMDESFMKERERGGGRRFRFLQREAVHLLD